MRRRMERREVEVVIFTCEGCGREFTDEGSAQACARKDRRAACGHVGPPRYEVELVRSDGWWDMPVRVRRLCGACSLPVGEVDLTLALATASQGKLARLFVLLAEEDE